MHFPNSKWHKTQRRAQREQTHVHSCQTGPCSWGAEHAGNSSSGTVRHNECECFGHLTSNGLPKPCTRSLGAREWCLSAVLWRLGVERCTAQSCSIEGRHLSSPSILEIQLKQQIRAFSWFNTSHAQRICDSFWIGDQRNDLTTPTTGRAWSNWYISRL